MRIPVLIAVAFAAVGRGKPGIGPWLILGALLLIFVFSGVIYRWIKRK